MSDSVGYEYKEITVGQAAAALYASNFPKFGWEPVETTPRSHGANTVTLGYRRDRKIRNKAELARLQRQFEQQAAEIEAIMRKGSVSAMLAAYAVGAIGMAFLAALAFAVISGTGDALVYASLGLPAAAGLGAPYFLYRRIKERRNKKDTPLIEQKQSEIFAVCERSYGLIG